MQTLVVVNNTKEWSLTLPNVQVVEARQYLTNQDLSRERRALVFNLCRSLRYQSLGYYVSLLAAARGHRVMPSLSCIQEMKNVSILRYVSEDLDELIQHSLKPLQSHQFTLSVYFGTNMAKRYEQLSRHLFGMFDAPLLRANFVQEDGEWRLQRVQAIGANDIQDDHLDFVRNAAQAFFDRPRYNSRRRKAARYSLAILHNPEEKMAPSDEKALSKFERAGRVLGLEVQYVEKEDYGRIAEFDALFIRETTQVNHHTFRFSQRAAAEGLVVIDDPDSILKCSNKVYLAEMLSRYKLLGPKTVIVHRDNVSELPLLIGLPCVLKQPDSSFSQGVFKVEQAEDLTREAQRLLEKSDLIIAQEFVTTPFDWRVGIIDQKPLYVCRYYMARKHWQIQKTESTGQTVYGKVDTLSVEQAPRRVVQAALKAANAIGNGLYGVDLKELDGSVYVIEVNDNPSIDSGLEDAVLKDSLYERIMEVFLQRIERVKQGRSF
jgi:glutathione synthase/RimK-type ligase-like ATP-grasp enzyme